MGLEQGIESLRNRPLFRIAELVENQMQMVGERPTDSTNDVITLGLLKRQLIRLAQFDQERVGLVGRERLQGEYLEVVDQFMELLVLDEIVEADRAEEHPAYLLAERLPQLAQPVQNRGDPDAHPPPFEALARTRATRRQR